ncbi:PIG-L deacetylase family protein [Herbihabitans rhizosphaerae]|uniref:PIG-L deacetylase family protein n=1 Tax=Herbihabitans rhizosphaerae TaxID=1872711 RepID=UPI001A9399ED|nr:PIG-L deacetylase family protein [Herbihabitans rhizosphaerae]
MSDTASDLAQMPEDWERALAVVAHPDDLEYGASSAIARWAEQGKSVVYLLVTRGEAGIDGIAPAECGALREREQIEAAAVVGVREVEFLDHRDGVIEYGLPLRADIATAIRRHRPELMITLNHRDTWGGTFRNSPDHRNVGLAVLDAVGDAANRWIFPERITEDAQPWNGVRWVAVAGSAEASHAVEITDTLDKGVASLEAHRAYLDGLSGDMGDTGFLRTVAEDTARRFGGRLATAFELISFS